MLNISLNWPWLSIKLQQNMQVLSWAVHRPGFVMTDQILWREVRNSDLSVDVDVGEWLGAEVAGIGASDAVVMLTSRNVRTYQTAEVAVDEINAVAIATVGLSNLERVGSRLTPDEQKQMWGTINVAVITNQPLSQIGLLEASSIITEARTTAVIEADVKLPTGIATGTGTDCVAIAAPIGEENYAGLHTPQGEAIGRAAYQAVSACVQDWITNCPI